MGVSLNKQQNFSKLPAGAYPAILTGVIEIGTQVTMYQGEEREKETLLLVWEVSKSKTDGKPFVLSQRLTNTLNPKGQLYKTLCSIMRKKLTAEDCDNLVIGNLLDSRCLLTVTIEESGSVSTYNKIVSVSPLPDGVCCNPRVGNLIEFGLSDIHDDDLFGQLLPWVQQAIRQSKELSALVK